MPAHYVMVGVTQEAWPKVCRDPRESGAPAEDEVDGDELGDDEYMESDKDHLFVQFVAASVEVADLAEIRKVNWEGY